MDNPERKIVIIGLVWPEPTSSAAGTRMLQLVRIFREQGWKITFASPAQTSDYSEDLASLGLSCIPIELNCYSFETFLIDLAPQIVLFDRFVIEEQFGWRVARACPTALRILDTEDLHFLRAARTKAFIKNRKFSESDLLTEEVSKREIASIYRCDLSLIISEVELRILTERFKVDKSLLQYLPLFAEKDEVHSLSFKDRTGFVFIGNFLHAPNVDAVVTLKNQIWPLILKKMPDATLNVYGAYVTGRIQQLRNDKDRFFIHGRADEAATVLGNARILLAPLNFGAGLKGKLLEAMQVGTPSVTTPVGAEGINDSMKWAGAIAEDNDIFTMAAVELYNNIEKWETAQQYGYEILHSRFKRELFIDIFVSRLDSFHLNLQTHRASNFIGAMLMHHTVSSAKYMSMWIEEKNKVK